MIAYNMGMPTVKARAGDKPRPGPRPRDSRVAPPRSGGGSDIRGEDSPKLPGLSTHPRCAATARNSSLTRIRAGGFSLIELLVSISIIALLVSILLPALNRARASAKAVMCAATLRELGLGLISYANENDGLIPRGPACVGPYDFACADIASNQLWMGGENLAHKNQPHGLGMLMKEYVKTKDSYYCPADDSLNLEEELPRIGTELNAYGSYTYRQLDFVPPSFRRGQLSDLGVNTVGESHVRVEALVMDTNSLGPEALKLRQTNHQARIVNVLYRDRSVRTFTNKDGLFSIPAETFASPPDIFTRLDQILLNADFGYAGPPAKAPQIPRDPN